MNKQSAQKTLSRVGRLFAELDRMQIPVYAANACYFIILSVFPILLMIISILRFTPLRPSDLVELLERAVPGVLIPWIQRLVDACYNGSTGVVVSLSALTALWSASRGIYGLLTGLNGIYGVREDRGYFYTRAISVLYTFAFLLVVVLTLVLHVFGRMIMEAIPDTTNPLLTLLSEILDIREILLLAIQVVVFTAMFMVFPNRRNKLYSSLPGAIFAALGWYLFSRLFSMYVEYFTSYTNIFGSVYTVALAMLWLYFCISILFYGGAINRLLTARKDAQP